MTQKIHNHFFTMSEIGRVIVPEALSSFHSFITLKNLRTLLRVTHLFWYCCYSADPSSLVASPSTSTHITELLQMIDNTTSKSRDCNIQYK
jgi:hypothetical protein